MTLVGPLDYETPTDTGDTAANNTYLVIVTATDSFGNATDQLFRYSDSKFHQVNPIIQGPSGAAVATD